MTYRIKLYLSLVGIAVASIVLGLVIFSTQSEKLVFDMLKSRVRTIAATGAAGIDPPLFTAIKKGVSIDSPEYKKAKTQLVNILNANRRTDIYVSDIYTLYRDQKDRLLYSVGATPSPYTPGRPYMDSDKQAILDHWNTGYIDQEFITDQYGTWLSAYYPFRNDQGEVIGLLGVDLNALDVHFKLGQVIKFAAWGLSSSIVLSILFAFFLSKQVSSSLRQLSGVVQEIAEGNLEARSSLKTKDEFSRLGEQINLMAAGLQERNKLKTGFARYVSTHILEKILNSEASLNLVGERRKVTLLFSDIRQFTYIAEKLDPEEVVKILNEYFEQMIEVVFAHSGTLDKFIGDGIMVEFGAPLDDEKQEEHAVKAAIEMQRALDGLCAKWSEEGRPTLQMGIGIHTGEAVMGNIGSERRTSYTAIGDTVNVASRLKQATKVHDTSIIVSESTYLACKDLFPFKDLGLAALPGRKEQIHIYSVDKNANWTYQ